MNDIKNKSFDNRRRQLIFGGLAVGASSLLQACGGGSAEDIGSTASAANASSASGATGATNVYAAETTVVTTPRPIPANVVRLADYGGVPGAAAATIISAFNQALTQLKGLGGGTLQVGPGVYDFGTRGAGTLVYASGLSNVLISAYGAQMTMTTTADTAIVTPVFFTFNNPNNITIAGMSFKDYGAINSGASANHGLICINITSSVSCSGFKTVDVVADSVVRLLMASQPDTGRYTFEGFDLHGTVKNAYYGAGCIFNGANSKVNLTVHNVRRAFIGYGLRNWDLTINASADGIWPGSNAFVEIAADNRESADTVKVNLTATGNMKNYVGLVNFYMQGSSTSATHIRNVKANVTLNNVTSPAGAVFLFPYEAPSTGVFASTTLAAWEQIQLNAAVVGSYTGTFIKNPSISSASTTSINVASGLAARQNMSALPNYFHVITQCSA
ncbi:hypothetical protein [Noviherbaspirillum denitrificans]|uniref:Pectate lyase superfamily protein domain-containing protein n=1 Tax=Noviherbaspirillum denitrificans TaxID=1968433 RepID=A0A254T7D0_9BURK|nr:hypothetical protein [Noviherbaspirillum denitrificans]OWW18559.1 hypothetical protein AYR66_00660 [Noviherbaspirillum denitrificans]